MVAGITPPTKAPVSNATRPSANTARALEDGAGSGSIGWRVGAVAGNVTYPS